MRTVFLRAVEADDKEAVLRMAINAPDVARGRQRFELDLASFAAVPRSPLAYWVSKRLRRVFVALPPLEAEGRTAKCGLGTLDDFRFLRAWWETQPQHERWVPIVSGGRHSPWYSSVNLTLAWLEQGRELKTFVEAKVGSASRKIQSEGFYFRPGLTWPLRGIRFSAQAVASGCAFSVAGKMTFAPPDQLLPLLALFNSAPFDRFIAFFAGKVGGVQYEAGLLQRIPVPPLELGDQSCLAGLARQGWRLKRELDTCTENSHAFILPALLQAEGKTLGERASAWNDWVRVVEAELAAIQAEIDEHCFELYGIGESDRQAITEGFGPASASVDGAEASDTVDETEDADDEGGEEAEVSADAATLVAELASWAVGTAFGRFNLWLATGARPIPPEPEPFDPLPDCSPGMLAGENGLPEITAPGGYPLELPDDAILVDDPGHQRDLAAAARTVFEIVFGGESQARWDEAATLLDSRIFDLRAWLARDFFELHVRRYSKSRRKAPIYWQFSTPSASYSVWLYIHRTTSDTLFTVLNEYVGPKLEHEERRLGALLREVGTTPSASQRKPIEDQEAFVEELRTFQAEVTRVAPLWDPDLNDGVIVNFAPLWRLVPQHRAWQREVKACWDALCAGKHDWSHLAMRLWPERVVPKCAEDRALAIAHDLEDDFWVEGSDGKWQKRPADPGRIARLVEERTSPAVKAALAELLAAPVPTSGRGSGRRGTAAR